MREVRLLMSDHSMFEDEIYIAGEYLSAEEMDVSDYYNTANKVDPAQSESVTSPGKRDREKAQHMAMYGGRERSRTMAGRASDTMEEHSNSKKDMEPFCGQRSHADYWLKSKPEDVHQPEQRGTIIETKVVGVTYEGRQEIIARMQVGEQLTLVREPNNPHDRNAISVCRQDGTSIGFINRHMAAGLAQQIDRMEEPAHAVVTALYGGGTSEYNRGVKIRFLMPGST